MATIQFKWVVVLILLINSSFIFAHQNKERRRMLLELEDEEKLVIKKKVSTYNSTTISGDGKKASSKNQTKLIKPVTVSASSLKNNQTKLSKLPFDSAKNKTKQIKTIDLLDNPESTIKPKMKKLNSTTNSTTKGVSASSPFTRKSSDLQSSKKLDSSKNLTTKGTTTTSQETKAQLENGVIQQKLNKTQIKKAQKKPNLIEEDDDLVAEFSNLPAKFQETIVPDLERISKTSKSYISKYNKQFARGFQPYVGKNYAPRIASLVSFAFIVIPLILVSLIFNRIKAYFSLQKILIFIQIYLAIYFSILCLSSLVTGLEPVRFFYSTSQSTYVCVQVLQTLSYVLYLVLLLMYLILVFSADTPPVTKLLGLSQAFVGFAVGLHYYVTVFHRAVLRQPPKTSWKVHAIYATCFVVICLLGRFDRKKKAYVEEGGEEGKKN